MRFPPGNDLFRELWEAHCDASEVPLMNQDEFIAASQAFIARCLAACDQTMRRFNTDYYQPERSGALECKTAITHLSKNIKK